MRPEFAAGGFAPLALWRLLLAPIPLLPIDAALLLEPTPPLLLHSTSCGAQLLDACGVSGMDVAIPDALAQICALQILDYRFSDLGNKCWVKRVWRV